MQNENELTSASRPVPVHLISGFLGSGKTTLLNRVIDFYKEAGVKVAVVMNELGEVNLDGQFVDDDVPMAEMLGGCICCSIRGDIAVELKMLIEEHRPDVVLIESTGAANPIEIIDAVTEAALFLHIELRTIAAVVDGPELLARSRSGGRTYKLMQDQIRCATDLLVNKADKLDAEQLVETQQLIREMNAYAPLTITVRCMTELDMFGLDAGDGKLSTNRPNHERHICGANCKHDHEEHHSHGDARAHEDDGSAGAYDSHSQEGHEHAGAPAAHSHDGHEGHAHAGGHDSHAHDDHANEGGHDSHAHDDHAHAGGHDSHAHDDHAHAGGHDPHTHDGHSHGDAHDSHAHDAHAHHDYHHSHSHVMSLTHYFDGPIDSHAFEAMMTGLPQELYRAKGVVTFSDTNSRFLFQYAYRELELIKITPQGKVNDVAVFIGEHFSKENMEKKLERLQAESKAGSMSE